MRWEGELQAVTGTTDGERRGLLLSVPFVALGLFSILSEREQQKGLNQVSHKRPAQRGEEQVQEWARTPKKKQEFDKAHKRHRRGAQEWWKQRGVEKAGSLEFLIGVREQSNRRQHEARESRGGKRPPLQAHAEQGKSGMGRGGSSRGVARGRGQAKGVIECRGEKASTFSLEAGLSPVTSCKPTARITICQGPLRLCARLIDLV